MYAIVDIAGQQFKVQKDEKIFVHRLDSEIGSQVDFDKVLLIDNESNVVVGTPVIEGAMITAKVLEHLKGDKVIVFKKKRRKGYKVKNGHRQFFTQLEIEDIIETGAKPKAVKKQAAEEVKAEVKVEDKVEVKAEVKVETKKPAAAKPKAEKITKTESAEAPAKKEAVAKKTTAAKKPAAPKKAAAPKKPAAPKKAAAAKKTEGKASPAKAKKADDTDK